MVLAGLLYGGRRDKLAQLFASNLTEPRWRTMLREFYPAAKIMTAIAGGFVLLLTLAFVGIALEARRRALFALPGIFGLERHRCQQHAHKHCACGQPVAAKVSSQCSKFPVESPLGVALFCPSADGEFNRECQSASACRARLLEHPWARSIAA